MESLDRACESVDAFIDQVPINLSHVSSVVTSLTSIPVPWRNHSFKQLPGSYPSRTIRKFMLHLGFGTRSYKMTDLIRCICVAIAPSEGSTLADVRNLSRKNRFAPGRDLLRR